MDLKVKKAIVVGAGKSGISAAKFLCSQGADVILNDMNDLDGIDRNGIENAGLCGGGHRPEVFADRDLIVLSPGVPADKLPLAGILVEAEKRGAEIISELELGWRFVKSPVIAVAGTNGKSTTTSLLGAILKSVGKRVFVGGNIGTPLTEYLNKGIEAEIIVLEVSSFQLERVVEFRPFIAIMLNISPDHLDRYRSMDEYVEAKVRLFENQSGNDYAILNMEDPIVEGIGSHVKAKIIPFGTHKAHKGGVYIKDDLLICEAGEEVLSIKRELIERGSITVVENIMAVFAAGSLLGLTSNSISEAMGSFAGLPHRMEYVGELAGVKFYDDSKGTNVGATLKSLEAMPAGTVLIAGGKDKGGGYEDLRTLVREKVKALVLIGESAKIIESVLGGETEIFHSLTMYDAVEKAWTVAQEGTGVLLSPACSSFDMFENYAERGKAFSDAVHKLSLKEGVTKKEAAIGR